MSEPDDGDVRPTVIAPGAFASQVGKVVPVRDGLNGPVIGQATVRDDGKIDIIINRSAPDSETG